MRERLRAELDAGGLAIGMGIQYTPGATRLEIIDVFRLAAERRVPVYTHMRSAGRIEPGSAIEATSEVIGAAAITGASLHIVHINSTCARDAMECLSMVEGARARGLDVTTEAYPYTAGMTTINSALFNPGWREKFGIGYSDLVLPETGEHLTKERFDELHNSSTSHLGIALLQYAGDGGQSDPSSAGHDRQRWRARPSPQRRDLLACAGAIRARKRNDHADGCAAKNESHAGADARAFHSGSTKKADCRRAPTPTLLFSTPRPSATAPLSRSRWSRAWACAIWWSEERWLSTKARSCRMFFRDELYWGRASARHPTN